MLDSRINSLASQLSKMSPQQRQQFAKLHKDDPIAVGMAKYVNDQENAVRQAFALKDAPAAFGQPSVVDQTIAQMSGPKVAQPMPSGGAQEPQAGVGALAAPNLASMPDGGIAGDPGMGKNPSPMGYAGGGAVQHFRKGGGADYTDPMGNVYPGADDAEQDPETIKGIGEFFTKPRLRGTGPMDSVKQIVGYPGTHVPTPAEMLGTQRPDMTSAPPVLDKDRTPVPMPQAGIGAPQQPPQPPAKTPMEQALEAAKQFGGGQGGGGGAPVGIGAPGGDIGMKPPAPMDPQAMYDKGMEQAQGRPDPLANERNRLAQANTDLAQQHASNVKAMQDALGIIGGDREGRLNTRAAKLDIEEGDNKSLALISAGLAMMAGTSPNAFANIGAGAQVGMKQYQEGKQKIDAAREKIDDAYWQLEELRHSEKRMNAKERMEAEEGIQKSVVHNMELAYQGAQHMFDTNRDNVMKMMAASVQLHGQDMQSYSHLKGADITGRYTLAGHQASAGAHERAAETTARSHIIGIGLQNQGRESEVKHMALMLGAEKGADAYIKQEQARLANAYQPPMTPSQEAAARERYHQIVNGGRSGGIGTPGGAPQDTTPQYDPASYIGNSTITRVK